MTCHPGLFPGLLWSARSPRSGSAHHKKNPGPTDAEKEKGRGRGEGTQIRAWQAPPVSTLPRQTPVSGSRLFVTAVDIAWMTSISSVPGRQ